jgi:hypothetical protein
MKMTQLRRGATLAVMLLASAVAQSPQQMPRIAGESFAGHQVELPDAARGNIAVLIFGFSKASKVPSSAWAEKLGSDFGSQTGFAFYQLPVLEDVPRIIRGMVISGMKKGVPVTMRDHFVPILEDEAELKRLVSYREPDDAYVVLLGRSGQIVGQRHDSFSDPGYRQLHGEILALLDQK